MSHVVCLLAILNPHAATAAAACTRACCRGCIPASSATFPTLNLLAPFAERQKWHVGLFFKGRVMLFQEPASVCGHSLPTFCYPRALLFLLVHAFRHLFLRTAEWRIAASDKRARKGPHSSACFAPGSNCQQGVSRAGTRSKKSILRILFSSSNLSQLLHVVKLITLL